MSSTATITMTSLANRQGTAITESTLCTNHQTPEYREWIEKYAPDDAARPFQWVDSSDNDAVECAECGTRAGTSAPVPHTATFTFTVAPENAERVVNAMLADVEGNDGYPDVHNPSFTTPAPLVEAPDGDDLSVVVTADQFMAFMAPHVASEAVYTEENNETRSLGDYLAGLHRRLTVMQGLDSRLT